MKLTQRQAFNRLNKMANGAYITVDIRMTTYKTEYVGYIADKGHVYGKSFEDVVKKMTVEVKKREERLDSETNA